MWVKILLIIFVFSFIFRTDHSFDQDLGRHLKLGEIIAKTGAVPKNNLFSYTNPDFPFINTHWLFEVLVYGFDQTVGLYPLLILKIVIILTAVWITLKMIPKENSALLLPIGFIFLHILRERLELRPEIFSFLFTAGTYYILEQFIVRAKARTIFFLPLIQLIWINTHIYFFVGLVLQAIFLIHLGYQHLRFNLRGYRMKILTIIFVLSVLVSLINPNGLKGLLYPLNVNQNYGYTIVENQTMSFLENINFRDANFLFVKLSVGIVALSLVVTLIRRRFPVKEILLAISGVVLALYNVRSFPYLVFLSLPATCGLLGPIKWRSITKFLSFIFALVLIGESFFYLNGDYYRYRDDQHQVSLRFTESAREAMDFLVANNLPQPIFNNFDIGSYIIYRGYPMYRVFVDGRPEAYPAQFFSGIYIPAQIDYNNFRELDKIYNFKTIIFSHTDQTPWAKNFLGSVIKDADWRLVYIDDLMLVLVKTEVLTASQLQSIDLASLNPSSYQFDNHLSYLRLGLFLLANQYQNGALFIQKSLQVFPGSPVANAVMGNPTKNYFFW